MFIACVIEKKIIQKYLKKKNSFTFSQLATQVSLRHKSSSEIERRNTQPTEKRREKKRKNLHKKIPPHSTKTMIAKISN